MFFFHIEFIFTHTSIQFTLITLRFKKPKIHNDVTIKIEIYLSFYNSCNFILTNKQVIDKGLSSITKALRKYDIGNRFRICTLGGEQSGKTSMLLSLRADNHNVADGATFDVPVHLWYPLQDRNGMLLYLVSCIRVRGIVVLNVECEFRGRSSNPSECHSHVMLTLGKSTLP